MIVKGSARGGAGELATHLLRQDTNERVTVLEMSGVASLDLRGALYELDFMGAGSRSQRRLYHASINTPTTEPLNFAMQEKARDRLADELGLAGQPYVMVEHIKQGRQHLHIVWSRVDVETGRAISDSHNFRKHELVCRELEHQFGHEPVLGAHVRDKKNEPRPGRGPTWGEQRQAERSGMTPQAAKSLVTELWQQTTTGRDFKLRLEAAGFILAKGDRRDFVLIDQAGELHGLTKRIDGARAKDVRDRMADIDRDTLAGVDEARQLIRQRQREQENAATFGVVGTAERLRAEELKREAEARTAGGPRLSAAHREAADAIWQLQKTMRQEIDAIVPSQPLRERIELPKPVGPQPRETLAMRLQREAREQGIKPDPPAPVRPLSQLRAELERRRTRRIEDDIPLP